MVQQPRVRQITGGVEEYIADFFKEIKSVTKKDCDNLAARIVGGSVQPSSLQGSTSYTVVAADGAGPVVQFRADNAALDLGLLRHVEETYGGLCRDIRVTASWAKSTSTR